MLNDDLLIELFYPTFTPMIDSYNNETSISLELDQEKNVIITRKCHNYQSYTNQQRH